jgi:TPR repeat protein
MRLGLSGLGVLLLAAMPAFADTAAGLTAFKSKDYERAYQEWKAAADTGHAEAQFDLGVLYAKGLGVPRDQNQAANWYGKAASQGNAEAEFALAHRLDDDGRFRHGAGCAVSRLLVSTGSRQRPCRGAIQPGPNVRRRQGCDAR